MNYNDALINIGRGIKKTWKQYHFLVPPKEIKRLFRSLRNIIWGDRNVFCYNPLNKRQYKLWLKKNEEKDITYDEMDYKPLISFLIPVYNVEGEYLKECLESVLAQTYDNFEICIVDDASVSEETIDVLNEYEKNERIRIKRRKQNGHISKATNDALKMAKGEYIALMDDDDLLAPNALMEVVRVLNKDRKIDMVYTDEDKIGLDGERCDPNFKSDYAPDSLLSSNYISHLGVLRKTIVEKVGGFRVGYEGAQDYDLYLRFTEETDRIYHIPKVLYHWRKIPGSTSMEIGNKNYALERGRLALRDALDRRGIKGKVRIAEKCPYYYIEYKIEGSPRVSIIIPTRDHAGMTRSCLESIYAKTTYSNYEVIVVDNGSKEKDTLAMFDEFGSKYDNFRVIKADIEFNYAKLNNLAVKESKADYILLLNNDTTVITPNWIELMVGYASQRHVGAVGVKLLYPDDTIQHAGVVMGIGVASHVFVGERRSSIVWGGRLTVPYNYSAVTAACLMVDRKKWNEVGGLEEDLKVAYNDVDFCLKLLEKGYYNVMVPMVELYHFESKSRGKDDAPEKKERFDWEQDYMRKKWGKRIENDEFYNPNYSKRTWFMLDKETNK